MSHTIITFLSDLGLRDASVTVAKAALAAAVPRAVVVDVSHNVVPYDLRQAAYILLSAYRHFPARTTHIVAVDVFNGEAPRMLLAEKDGHFFIAPDNGILPLAFGADPGKTWLCFEFTKPFVFNEWIIHAGQVIAALATNAVPVTPYTISNAPLLQQPKLMPDGIDCSIRYIDHYGNVVLDITKAQFEELVNNRPFRIKIMRLNDITAVSTNYNDVGHGAPLCRFNSTGYLELALNHAPAAALLGLDSFTASGLRYQTIKIYF